MKEDIHVRIDEALMHRVRTYADSRGISLAAAVSILLSQSLNEGRA